MRPLLPLALLFTLCACAPPAPVPPAWLDNEGLRDGLGGVGAAPAGSPADRAQQRAAALADARGRLSGKVQARVEALFLRLNLRATQAAREAGLEPVRAAVLKRVQEAVTREVGDQALANAEVRATWTDPVEGTCFVFLVTPRLMVDQALKRSVLTTLRRELAPGEPAFGFLRVALEAEGAR